MSVRARLPAHPSPRTGAGAVGLPQRFMPREPWTPPKGRPTALAAVIRACAPWLLERTGDGGQPYRHAGDPLPTEWRDDDRDRRAHDEAGRLARAARRMAHRENVPPIEAGRFLADQTLSDAERGRVPGHERIPAAGTPARRDLIECMAKAIDNAARPDRAEAKNAAPGMASTSHRPRYLSAEQRNALHTHAADMLQVTRDALAGRTPPGPPVVDGAISVSLALLVELPPILGEFVAVAGNKSEKKQGAKRVPRK